VFGSLNSQSQSCKGVSFPVPGSPRASIHFPESVLTIKNPRDAYGAGTVGGTTGGAMVVGVGGAIGVSVINRPIGVRGGGAIGVYVGFGVGAGLSVGGATSVVGPGYMIIVGGATGDW
jgi:hypothetical protein